MENENPSSSNEKFVNEKGLGVAATVWLAL
jgi:hypothetical protein